MDLTALRKNNLPSMQILKSKGLFSVELHPRTWLVEKLQWRNLRAHIVDNNGRPKDAVILVHLTTDEPWDVRLDFAYAHINSLEPIHGATIRAYPSEIEAWQE